MALAQAVAPSGLPYGTGVAVRPWQRDDSDGAVVTRAAPLARLQLPNQQQHVHQGIRTKPFRKRQFCPAGHRVRGVFQSSCWAAAGRRSATALAHHITDQDMSLDIGMFQ